METEQPDLDTPHGRLAWARERAGFADAASFARALRMNPVTYRAYETGQNGFSRHLVRFSDRLKVSVKWLDNGGPIPAVATDRQDLPQEDNRPPSHPFPTEELLLTVLRALAHVVPTAPETAGGAQAIVATWNSILRLLERNPAIADNPERFAGAVEAIVSERFDPSQPR